MKEVIRGHIGFDGLLLSDDLSMQALGGTLGERAARALAAGCDIALHCNGEMAEMVEVAADTGPMTGRPGRRFEAGRRLPGPPPRAAGKAALRRRGQARRGAAAGMGIRRSQIQWRCGAPAGLNRSCNERSSRATAC